MKPTAKLAKLSVNPFSHMTDACRIIGSNSISTSVRTFDPARKIHGGTIFRNVPFSQVLTSYHASPSKYVKTVQLI